MLFFRPMTRCSARRCRCVPVRRGAQRSLLDHRKRRVILPVAPAVHVGSDLVDKDGGAFVLLFRGGETSAVVERQVLLSTAFLLAWLRNGSDELRFGRVSIMARTYVSVLTVYYCE